ncbi:MAG: N-acetyl-D-muramate 6-phosphate phosphatase [Gammaproteobacteria bacterium]|jgi:phosphoglycolate phosphatase|nr:N-acetyl-D-muramate 6-phosphate phosphatase [Gammaproteobacteria bacterium]
MSPTLRTVLFDLDGTLLDTAPDMVAALNALRLENQLVPLPYEVVRGAVSHGAAKLVKTGFPDAEGSVFDTLRARYLNIYSGALARGTRLFPGMDQVLDSLSARGLSLGIVTNKPGWLTAPLLEEMQLASRFVCVVSGDTVAERKPHPLPLLHAAQLAGVAAQECIYVGDALRDVQAARAANMPALIADYGYLLPEEDSSTWGGDAHLKQPSDLLQWLDARGRTCAS